MYCIRAPIAPNVPQRGQVGPPLNSIQFGVSERVHLGEIPMMEIVEGLNDWLFWDVTETVRHLRYSRKLTLTELSHFSPSFHYAVGNAILKWQLCLELNDADNSTASIFLGNVDSGNNDKIFLETTFSLQICVTLQNGKKVYKDKAEDLKHVFQKRSHWWGVQGFLDCRQCNRFRGNIKLGVRIDDCCIIGTNMDFDDLYLLNHNPFIFVLSEKPSIMCVENFVTQEQCEEIIGVARPHLSPSLVQTGGYMKYRKSSSMFFTGHLGDYPFVKEIERRLLYIINLQAVRGGHCKQKRQEALQVVHYQEGGFYRAHLDNKNNEHPIRCATVLLYLNDVEEGGCTHFSLAQKINSNATKGLRIQPRRGRLIMFWNRELDRYIQDQLIVHEAEPVTSGEKWILTRWYKDDHTNENINDKRVLTQYSDNTKDWLQMWQKSSDRIVLNAATQEN